MSGLGLAAPLGLVALLALAVLVWITFWERRRRPLAVASLMLWRPVRDETTRGRFEVDLLFLLQLLGLGLLAVALARPFLREAAAPGGGRTVFVFDVSASLLAAEPGGSRWARAKALALEHLAEIPAAELVGVVEAAARPRIVLVPTADRTAARRAIERLEAVEGPGRLEAALREGRSLGAGPLELVVVTDIARSATAIAAAPDERLRWVRVGQTDDNVAITELRVHQSPFEVSELADAFADVANFASRPRVVTIVATLAGRLVHEERRTLEPRGAVTIPIRGLRGEGLLEVGVAAEGGDALATDDRALAVVRPGRRVRLVARLSSRVVAEELAALAAAVPTLDLEVLEPGAGPEALLAADVAIVEGSLPVGALPPRLLVLRPAAGDPRLPVEGAIAGARLLDWDENHPVLRDVTYLDPLLLADAVALVASPGMQPLVASRTEAGDVAVALAGRLVDSDAVVLGFGLRPGELRRAEGLNVLLLLLNSIRWLAPDDESGPTAVAVGDVVRQRSREPLGATVHAPGRPALVIPPSRRLEIPIEVAGAIEVELPERKRMFLASLLDASESDIGRVGAVEEVERTGERAAIVGRVTAGSVDLTPWLVVGALGALVAEWLVWGLRRPEDDA